MAEDEALEKRLNRIEEELLHWDGSAAAFKAALEGTKALNERLEYLLRENEAAKSAMGAALRAYERAIRDVAALTADVAVLKARLDAWERPTGGVM